MNREEATEVVSKKLLEYDFDRHGVRYGIVAAEILDAIGWTPPLEAEVADFRRVVEKPEEKI